MKPLVSPNKERITITIDARLLDWLDEKVRERRFANRSHGLEYLIEQRIEQQQTSNTSKTNTAKNSRLKEVLTQ